MARTIAEIKREMADRFMADATIKTLYDLQDGKTFDEQFRSVSLECILFHIVAACTWTLETLFDLHREEVDNIIAEFKPHTLRWYVNKVRAYQHGRPLDGDTDEYDNAGVADADIAVERVVAYCAVVEKAGVLYVKVAKDNAGQRTPLDAEEYDGLQDYVKRVKDAGVKTVLRNDPADRFDIRLDLYYDPLVFNASLSPLSATDRRSKTVIQDTIKKFVENLPFNGEYRNVALVGTLAAVTGIVIPEIKEAWCNGVQVDARAVPTAGYFTLGELTINAQPYASLSD